MDIPSLQPTKPDIFSYGFGKNLERATESTGTSTVYDHMKDGINAAQILPGGNLTLKTLTVGGLVKQVAPGDDIQAAIDAVSREGGGTIQLIAGTYYILDDIYLKSNTTLAGAGRDLTILDFGTTTATINAIGTATSVLKNIFIRDLTIRNGTAATRGGLDFEYVDYWGIEGVGVTAIDGDGIDVVSCQNFFIVNTNVTSCVGSGITGDGIWIGVESGTRATQNFLVQRCTSSSNRRRGIVLDGYNNLLTYGNILNCTSSSNSSDGFAFEANATSSMYVSVLGCVADSNVGKGICVTSPAYGIYLLACVSTNNTDDSIELNTETNTVIGCKTDGRIDVNLAGNIIVGNQLLYSATDDPSSSLDIATGQWNLALNNSGDNTRTRMRTAQMKNTDGATLPTGAVVILKSIATGDEIGTTTTNGDNKVFGVTGTTNTNNGWGRVIEEGVIDNLYVTNGTSSVVIGDWLSAYSHAYYAKKAVAGDTVFAMALSTPTTSTASISALLVSPRLI